MLVWSGGESGQVYFSQANAGRAVVPSAWSDPQALPSPVAAGSSPDILVSREGTIYVVYAIPLNEQRGIYITWSMDEGQTWAQPIRVFDSSAAGWAMVDKPRLAQTENGHLHLLWTRYSLPTGIGPMALYYARSEDGGLHWSQPATVVERAVLWSRVIGIGERTVHRVWQELSSGRTTLWHEQSQDSGLTWKRIAPVSIFGETVGEPALTNDRSGRLHLLQVVIQGTISFGTQNYALQHWMYDGERWATDQSLDIANTVNSGLSNLVALVSSTGNLAVSFSGTTVDPVSGASLDNLFYTSRSLEIPASAPTPLPPLTPTPIVVSTPTPQLQASPSPTAQAGSGTIPLDQLPSQPDDPVNAWLASVVGPIVAGLIILVVFIVGVRGVGLRRR
jgi:hypothetical protein